MKQDDLTTVSFCPQPWSNLFLRSTGRLQPCCMNSTHLGDISKNSLDEVWNGQEMQKVRHLIINKKYKEAGCKLNCPALYILNTQKSVSLSAIPWLDAAANNQNFKENLYDYENSVRNKELITSQSPITLDIQPTEACNMQCIMCHQQHGKQEKIAPELIATLFRHHESLFSVRFQGGEIFLDPRFAQFIIELKNRFLPYQSIVVITNGSRLSLQQLAMMTAGSNPIKFIVSVDATNKTTYQKIRKSPLFEKVMGTIKYLSERQLQKQIPDIVRWNFVIMRSNFHQIKKAIKLAARLQIEISFQPIIGPYPKENMFDYPELRLQTDQSYIKECHELTQVLGAKVFNLTTVAQKLS